MSRRLEDLTPDTREKVEKLIEAAKAEGIALVVVHTLRSYEEQALLFEKGRSRPGPIVTNARPGYSWHNFGRAADFAFLIDGKLSWEGPWERFGILAERCGLRWGGNFRGLKDRPHVENSLGFSLTKLRAERLIG